MIYMVNSSCFHVIKYKDNKTEFSEIITNTLVQYLRLALIVLNCSR